MARQTPGILSPYEVTSSDVARFWSHVRRLELDGCWEWTGHKRDGYGYFHCGNRVKRHAIRAHRFSAMLAYGEGTCLLVLHSCDNTSCVNPNHLFFGNDAANVSDKELKGRHNPAHGEQCRTTRLTEETVRAIRADGRGSTIIAREYGVAQQTISDILNNKTWRRIIQ